MRNSKVIKKCHDDDDDDDVMAPVVLSELGDRKTQVFDGEMVLLKIFPANPFFNGEKK